jgi:hypothetical protein
MKSSNKTTTKTKDPLNYWISEPVNKYTNKEKVYTNAKLINIEQFQQKSELPK